MTEKNIISLELKHHRVANNRNYYEDLFVPANDAEITDIKQRLRCLFGEEPEVTVLGIIIKSFLKQPTPLHTNYNACEHRYNHKIEAKYLF